MSDSHVQIAIETALLSYCRGIDRLHGPSIAAAFHPGALLIDYRSETLTIEAFIETILDSLSRRFVATQHRISNTIIERHGDSAKVETYVHATHIEATSDGRRLHTFVGRYIDQFNMRADGWKISQRILRNDWSEVSDMGNPMTGAYVPSGRGSSAADPIWEQF
jgi:SnoaL-like domain